MNTGPVLITSAAQADEMTVLVKASATRLQAWLTSFDGDGIGLLRALKFEEVGFHPLEDRALNAIEQVNQIWTYLTALSAVRHLLQLHPQANGFRIAPGAHAAQALDVMSAAEGLVGAETFAAVDPRNNRKLAKDLLKLAGRPEAHRYVFFSSPRFPGAKRLPQLERAGVEVWSVDV